MLIEKFNVVISLKKKFEIQINSIYISIVGINEVGKYNLQTGNILKKKKNKNINVGIKRIAKRAVTLKNKK